MKFEEQILIVAPTEKVLSMYANVEGRSSWDPDVKSSSLEGQFVSGATGTLQPSSGLKAKKIFTGVIPSRSFTVASKLLLCVMCFKRELSTSSGKTKALHRIIFKGLLAPLFGRLIGSQIRKGLPHSLKGLKRAAEQ